MDLKTELNRTETFKNNAITIKNQLDDAIVRGGGVHSETLADTVKNMQGMMKNYKKIAIINEKKLIGRVERNNKATLTFNFDLKFKYKKIFFTVEVESSIICSNDMKKAFDGKDISITPVSFTENSITITIENTSVITYETIYLLEIVAIE